MILASDSSINSTTSSSATLSVRSSRLLLRSWLIQAAFAQLFELVCRAAHALAKSIPVRRKGDSQPSVALLSPSCRDFLVHAFALFRLGYRVLLVAFVFILPITLCLVVLSHETVSQATEYASRHRSSLQRRRSDMSRTSFFDDCSSTRSLATRPDRAVSDAKRV